MTDPHPQNFEIEIDRDRLRIYLRAQALLAWVLIVGSIGAMMGMVFGARVVEEGIHSWHKVVLVLAAGFGIGLVLSLTLAGLLYLFFNHRAASRFAKDLRVSVEGPFLRIRQRLFVASDRKLHFRAIVDYAVVQEPVMRLFGLQALQMTTAGSGTSATITVPGVKDCLKVRDLLSEIDCQRENQS